MDLLRVASGKRMSLAERGLNHLNRLEQEGHSEHKEHRKPGESYIYDPENNSLLEERVHDAIGVVKIDRRKNTDYVLFTDGSVLTLNPRTGVWEVET